MKNDNERKKWKNEKARSRYGMSYISLCSNRKRVIDQLYELYKGDKNVQI